MIWILYQRFTYDYHTPQPIGKYWIHNTKVRTNTLGKIWCLGNNYALEIWLIYVINIGVRMIAQQNSK